MIAVWCIYTYDHLSDAKKIDKEAATFRHRFHQKHFQVLKYALIFAVLTGIAVASMLPAVVVMWGVICAACVAVYFLLLNLHHFWYKELLISVCYTVGVFLAPLSLSQTPLNPFQLLLIPQIFLLALANLVIFSCFDYKADQQDGHYSLAIHLGLVRSRKIALWIVVAGLVFCIPTFFFASYLITQEVQLLIFVMNLLLLMLLLKEKHFQQNELYRIVGDAVFFIPALLLLYAR